MAGISGYLATRHANPCAARSCSRFTARPARTGGCFSDQYRKLVIDDRGILYALGYTYGAYTGANADPSQATGDIFIQKFGPNLNLLGKLQFGTPYEDRDYLYLWNNWLYIGGITEASMVSANLGSFDGFVIIYPLEAVK